MVGVRGCLCGSRSILAWATRRLLSAGWEIPETGSLGSVISELARRGLTPARVEAEGDLPVIRVPAGSAPITPQMVSRALDED